MSATGWERQSQSQSQPAMEPGSCLLSFFPMQESTAHTRCQWWQDRHAEVIVIYSHKKKGGLEFLCYSQGSCRAAMTLKASFHNGHSYTDHVRTFITVQMPGNGRTPLLLCIYPEHQPACGEGSNLRLWAWQVLLLWRSHRRPNKLPTHPGSWS